MKGFSLIETIIAMGLFVVIASAAIFSSLGALSLNRLGDENTQAGLVASEGLDAVRSIKKQSWSNLTAGTYGVGTSNNLWKFVGTTNTIDQFTRSIGVSAVYRDVGGSIVSSGGTLDPDTIRVTSQVDWDFGPSRNNSLTLTEYFTNWEKTIAAAFPDGLVIYSRGTSTTPWFRAYTTSTNVFGVATSLPPLTGSPRNTVVRTSPQKSEAVAGILSTNGSLYVYCYNGTTWTQDWSVSIGVGTTRTRPFDIAYEATSGDVLVVYSTNTASTNELAYRTKLNSADCGSANWTSATNYNTLRTSAAVSWVKMAPNPVTNSNLIGIIWADWNKDLSGAIWDGSTIQNEMGTVAETSLEAINTGTSYPDVESFDLAYESLAGDLMTIWGISTGANGTNGVRYRLCTGNSATCTWGTITTPPTWADDATNLDLSANPNSDEMAFASIGNAGADMQAGYWSGVGWTNTANLDITAGAPLAGTKLVATGWLNNGSTSRSVVVYNDNGATNIGWYIGTRGTFAAQTDVGATPAFANPQKWYEIAVNPKSKDQLMFTLSDNNSDLFAKQLTMTSVPAFTWTAADGSTQVEPNLGSNIVKPFGFAYSIK